MLFLSTVASACSDAGLASILAIIKRVMGLIQIIGPILAIVSLIIHITMLVKDPDDKKRVKKIHNSVIALFVLFMVPVIVNATMSLLDDSTAFSNCWNSISTSSGNNNGGSYVSPYDDNSRTKVYTNPDSYQK